MISPPVLSKLVSNPSGLVPLPAFRRRHLCPPGSFADTYTAPRIPGAGVLPRFQLLPQLPLRRALPLPLPRARTANGNWDRGPCRVGVPLLKDTGTQRKGDTQG